MICKKKKDKTATLQVDGPAGCACSSQGQHFHLPSWPDESPGDKVQTQSYNSYDILHILYVPSRPDEQEAKCIFFKCHLYFSPQ